MNIYEEILTQFYNTSVGLYQKDDYFIFKDQDSYGVGLENINNIKIDENLANVEIKNISFQISDVKSIELIILTSSLKTHKNEFATFCSQFLEKGINNTKRIQVLNSPIRWWNNWKELIGNKLYKTEPYDILAELLCLEKVSSISEQVKWGGPKGSSVDIESKESYYEVKSSIVRYENEITINSQFQLGTGTSDTPYKIAYYKMEKLSGGETINKVMDRLKKNTKIDISNIEKELHKKGYRTNSSSRNISYVVYDIRLYNIDENFPIINKNSFKKGVIPDNIKKLSYVVSLEGLSYINWE